MNDWLLLSTGTFLAALALGAGAQSSAFCLQGGLRDVVQGGRWQRMAVYALAMATALIGVALLQWGQGELLQPARPPYLSAQLPLGRLLLGGVLFGVGMIWARGCPLRMLVKTAQGSVQALLLLAVMAGAAYAMSRTALYGQWIAPWLGTWSVDLTRHGWSDQSLSRLFEMQGLHGRTGFGLAFGGVLAVLALVVLGRRVSRSTWLGAVTIGLMVTAGYALTSGDWSLRLIDESAFMSEPPEGLGVQSFTFAGALGDVVYFLLHPRPALLSFSVLAVLGALAGAVLAALRNRQFRLEGVAFGELPRRMLGALLVGAGAVLGLGCTVGHGLAGMAVLSLGSLLGWLAISLGAVIALKVSRG